jgi:type VI secretion system protein ImpA
MHTEFEGQLARLAQPIEGEGPCGVSPEGTPDLIALEAQRVFGLLTPPDAQFDWRQLQTRSYQVLGQSKDFRALAHYTAAVLRTGTLDEALRLIALIEPWLTRYWDEVYPRLEEDAIGRRNALNCFADRVAIIDALRRLPLVVHPQLGAFSLRDIDIATGAQPNPDPDREPRTETEVHTAFEAADLAQLRGLYEHALLAAQALNVAQEIMRERCGHAGVPDLEPLARQLLRIQQAAFARIGDESANSAGVTSPTGDVAQPTQSQYTNGAIQSRQDAVRALEAAANYFRRNEPGSPIPLLVERAKRMVSMDFLELLADLAPEALEQARKATGVNRTD